MKKPINTFNAFVEDKDKDQKLIKEIEEYALEKMTDDLISLKSESILLNYKDDSSFEPIDIRMDKKRK